jgi:hypothetical protein
VVRDAGRKHVGSLIRTNTINELLDEIYIKLLAVIIGLEQQRLYQVIFFGMYGIVFAVCASVPHEAYGVI